MKENKVYVVQCSSGSWDMYHEWIAGVFDDNELEKDFVSKLQLRYFN